MTCMRWAASVAILAAASAMADEPAWRPLFEKEEWYKNAEGKEQIFRGKLEAVPGADAPSTLQRSAHYKLAGRTLYTGARKVDALDKLVGKHVEMRGKAIDMELEGQRLREIWPAAVRPFDGKLPAAVENPVIGKFGRAPIAAPAPAELKGRKVALGASTTVRGPITKGGRVDLTLGPISGAARSAEEFEKLLGDKRTSDFALAALKPDFTKQMVLVATAGVRSSGGSWVEMIEAAVDGKVMTVRWKAMARGDAATAAITHPGVAVVVEKFEGEVRFEAVGGGLAAPAAGR